MPNTKGKGKVIEGLLRKLVAVRPNEVRALLWSFGYFFAVLCAYYILRPLRDEMGIIGGTRQLHWLFTATFVAILCAIPLYGWVVARYSREKFIPIVYRFFILNILIFWLLLTFDIETIYVARAFFVWISVFVIFVVSVFWQLMSDLFRADQGKRLFAFIAAGGSAGVLLGPTITLGLVKPIGPVNLLIVAAIVLELAVFCMRRATKETVSHNMAGVHPTERTSNPLGGGSLSGFLTILKSPYLAGIALWVFLLSLAGTFLYFQQQNIVAAASQDSATRIEIFAKIELAVGLLTIIIQLAGTGRLISRFGVGVGAAILPLVAIFGFAVMAVAPVLLTVVIFQACQRTANFAISNPAREMFFTVADRESKFKAKSVIDMVVFRGGDAANGWLFKAMQGMGMEISGIAMATVPVVGVWFVLSIGLGRAHERRAKTLEKGEEKTI
jgi:ATP:ADP antiporter, AAA family